MGKDDDRKNKKRKLDGGNSQRVKYSDIPPNQRKTWIFSDEASVSANYSNLLWWIAVYCTAHGFNFDGIESIDCTAGFPLIEIEVIYKEKSKKFLISRKTLYILAFYSGDFFGWRKFRDKELIIDFGNQNDVLDRTAQYTNGKPPCQLLGPKAMIEALDDMDSFDIGTVARAVEVFAVHLCEATRLILVQTTIVRSLSTPIAREYAAESNYRLGSGSRSQQDIFPLLPASFVDLDVSLPAPPQVEHLIKRYSQLSKAWMGWVLSNARFCDLLPQYADNCGISSVRTLRASLGVLPSTDLDKLVSTLASQLRKAELPDEYAIVREIRGRHRLLVNSQSRSLSIVRE